MLWLQLTHTSGQQYHTHTVQMFLTFETLIKSDKGNERIIFHHTSSEITLINVGFEDELVEKRDEDLPQEMTDHIVIQVLSWQAWV